MLYVVTDIEDVRWLVYILEEFVRINKAEFSIQVVSSQININYPHLISYNAVPQKGICIPNRSHVRPNGKTIRISENISVFSGTTSEEPRYSLSYDLLWNAFIFLTRLEEYRSEKNGKLIRSYSFNHPRENKSTFDIPVVNYLFNKFEQFIRNNFPKLPFGQKQDPIIEYSHDVDYIQKTFQLRLKQTAFNTFKTFKSISNPIRFTEQAKRTVRFFFSNPSYWRFNYWEELEKKVRVRSVFYVYAKTGKKNLRSWMLDPSYDITENIDLQNRLKHLIQEGFEIGLHGSYFSATDEKMLSKEKSVLKESIGTEVQKTRQHWLRYEEMITPYIHNKLFKYDSTLGWNDCMGFRSGIAGRYRPYDHKKQRPFDYMITPQVIMDSNIYDYGADRVKCLEEKALKILKHLRQFKSAHISISWHQRVCSSDYGWQGLYEQIFIQEGRQVRQRAHIVN